MSIMGKQITIGQLLGILTSILIPVVGWLWSLGVDHARLQEQVIANKSEVKLEIANNRSAIAELKEDKKETNKKLDTIILMLTDVKVQVANKQDRR